MVKQFLTSFAEDTQRGVCLVRYLPLLPLLYILKQEVVKG